MAIPITIGSAGMQLLNVAEIGVYMGRLEDLLETGLYQGELIPILREEIQVLEDYTVEKEYSLMASSLKGIYNFAYTIFNMPCAFIIPINTSVLPAITEYLTLGNHAGVKSTEESAARITGLLAAPCAIGLAVLAGPIMGMLGGYSGLKLELAGQILLVMGIAVFFYSSVMFTNVLLQSHGKAHIPVINTLICGVAKLIALYFVTGNPAIGILGVPICSLACYLGVTVLNLACIQVMVPQKPALLGNLVRALFPAAIMGAVVYGCYWLLSTVGGITSNVILCGLPIVVGVVVYGAGVLLTKTLKKEDCLLLPKGEKLAKLLKL